MKYPRLIILCLCGMVGAVPLSAAESTPIPLGPIGGKGAITEGKAQVLITSLLPDAPGTVAGLRVNDVVIGVFGQSFSETPKAGYLGATQELALAIERAESADGKLALRVLRPGKGEIAVDVKLPSVGAYGPTYPVGSDKFSVTYEYACKKIAERVITSGGNQGFNGGWFGLALLGHPRWHDTYAKPLAALRDTALKKFASGSDSEKNSFAYAPVEDLLLDGKSKNPKFEENSGGPGNWELGAWTMFLAEYRRKTKDASVDAMLQRAAEMCANRIQWWKQPRLHESGYSPEYKDIAGIVSHGGVIGDYVHIGWGGGINMTGVHIFSALALAKQAGVKMESAPKDGHYFGFPVAPAGAVPAGMENKDFTLSEKFDRQWLVRCSGNDGAVGYTTGQGGSAGDASGRTSGTLFGLLASGKRLNPDDEKRVEMMKSYIAKEYHRLMEAHAYTHGGQCFYQLALPFLDDRSQRYIMENWRLFYVLSRQPDGTCAYFGGRGNNGGDGYLNNDAVMETVWALTGSVAHGGLPYIMAMPARDKNRVYVNFTAPYVRWPSLETRATTVVGPSHEFQIEVFGANGALLKTKQYKATWSTLKGGPSFASTKNEASTKVTFTGPGTYQLLLTVVHSNYTVKELVAVEVLAQPESSAITDQRAEKPSLSLQPQSIEVQLGGQANLSVKAAGRGPLNYTWRLDGTPLWPKQNTDKLTLINVGGGQAGVYDCVVTGADGVVTSSSANLTISNVGEIVAGGLWSEQFSDQSFLMSDSLDAFLAHARFPRWSDASTVLTVGVESKAINSKNGQRFTGWLVPKESATYQFFLTGSGQAQVNLSTSDACRNRRPLVAFSGNGQARQWTVGERSKPVHLSAGKRYYIELIHFALGEKPASIAMSWRAVTNTPGTRKDDAAPTDGSPAMPSELFEHRVGGMFDDSKVVFPKITNAETKGANPS